MYNRKGGECLRIHIKKKRESLYEVLVLYIRTLYINKESIIVFNEVEYQTTVQDVSTVKEGKHVFLVIETKEGVLKMPIEEKSFARFEGNVMYFESDIHDLMIELKGKHD